MEQTNNTTPSTKGKGLGIAGMVIGIIALIWSVIPLVGAAAWWLAVLGLVLSAVGFFMANGGGNPKKGMMITGIVLGVAATAMSFYRVYQVKQAMDAFQEMGVDFAKELKESMDSIKTEVQEAAKSDSTEAH
jgi:hypothetical protein